MHDDHYIYNPTPTGKMRFGRTEIRHIAIALGVLTLAFAIVLTRIITDVHDMDLMISFLYALGMSFVVVTTGFFLHEMGHKIVAQKYGAWAEFRIFPFGLIMALAFSFAGFIIAAPGAVYIQGIATRRENGLISIAGPAINLIIGIPFLLISYFIPISSILGLFIYLMAFVNALLAFFNLLPIPPMDGSKIYRWNAPIYAVIFTVSIVFLAVTYLG